MKEWRWSESIGGLITWNVLRKLIDLPYTEYAIDTASSQGKLDLLIWWQRFGFIKYSASAIDLACYNNRIESLDWWLKSGFDLKYTEFALDIAITHGSSKLILWWLDSGLPLKYTADSSVLKTIKAGGDYDSLVINYRKIKANVRSRDAQVFLDMLYPSEVRPDQMWEGQIVRAVGRNWNRFYAKDIVECFEGPGFWGRRIAPADRPRSRNLYSPVKLYPSTNWETRLFLDIENDLNLIYRPKLIGKESWPDDWSNEPSALPNYWMMGFAEGRVAY